MFRIMTGCSNNFTTFFPTKFCRKQKIVSAVCQQAFAVLSFGKIVQNIDIINGVYF